MSINDYAMVAIILILIIFLTVFMQVLYKTINKKYKCDVTTTIKDETEIPKFSVFKSDYGPNPENIIHVKNGKFDEKVSEIDIKNKKNAIDSYSTSISINEKDIKIWTDKLQNLLIEQSLIQNNVRIKCLEKFLSEEDHKKYEDLYLNTMKEHKKFIEITKEIDRLSEDIAEKQVTNEGMHRNICKLYDELDLIFGEKLKQYSNKCSNKRSK